MKPFLVVWHNSLWNPCCETDDNIPSSMISLKCPQLFPGIAPQLASAVSSYSSGLEDEGWAP